MAARAGAGVSPPVCGWGDHRGNDRSEATIAETDSGAATPRRRRAVVERLDERAAGEIALLTRTACASRDRQVGPRVCSRGPKCPGDRERVLSSPADGNETPPRACAVGDVPLSRGELAARRCAGECREGALKQPLAGLRDEPLPRRAARRPRALRRAVGGELSPAPTCKRRTTRRPVVSNALNGP